MIAPNNGLIGGYKKIMSQILGLSASSPFSIFMISSSLFLISSLFLLQIFLPPFSYAQSDNNLSRPITTKVVPSNFNAIPSNAPFSTIIPVTTKVVPSNFNAVAPLEIMPSFTMTNATVTFSYHNITGDLTKRYTSEITNSSHTTILIGSVT
jgi:hypothetical protein